MSLFPVFGKAPAGIRLRRIQHSPHYRDGSFQNLVPTEVMRKEASMFKMLRAFSNRPANTAPLKPLPSVRTDLRKLPDDEATLVWFGHSSYLLKIGKAHILVDPVFSGNASPVSFFARAFPGSDVYGVADMPDTIEAILLTHDHYDHLDYKTILQLRDRTNHFYTSLGVGAHLEFWGIEANRITELDWWEHIGVDVAGRPNDQASYATLTATPARHFSGRSLKRGGAIWSSFVLDVPQIVSADGGGGCRLFLGGDSGYEQHFKVIGDRFGPFHLAVLECGQYNENWPYIHMMPEQTVMAARDLRAAVLLPVHWGKFTLSLHPWDEPIRRVTAAAAEAGLPITTPRIGEPVFINSQYPNDAWYDFL
jgi:L-ascorbate metabolism protein UlaG (beta-lactamase superfamily)